MTGSPHPRAGCRDRRAGPGDAVLPSADLPHSWGLGRAHFLLGVRQGCCRHSTLSFQISYCSGVPVAPRHFPLLPEKEAVRRHEVNGPHSKVPRCAVHSARGEPDVWRCKCWGRGRQVWSGKESLPWGTAQRGTAFLKEPDSTYFRLASQTVCNSEVVAESSHS